MILLKLIVIILIIANGRAHLIDKTRTGEAVGKDVVEAVDLLIRNSKIFNESYGFLKVLAYVESKFGEDTDTFANRNGTEYNGGIWQVNDGPDGAFTKSKDLNAHPELQVLYSKINDSFGIDWNSVTWADCRKPLYSALAARLALEVVPELMIDWLQSYNTVSSDGTEQNFLEDLKDMQELDKCYGKLDLVIVLDGSESIGKSDFDLAKKFVADLIATFSSAEANVGFLVFSSNSKIIFGLDSNLTLDQMTDKTIGAAYPRGSTDTAGAIQTAVLMLKAVENRAGSPRIIATFTDGESDNPVNAAVVAEAKSEKITSFSIGIGADVMRNELMELAYGDTTHIFTLSSYLALSLSANWFHTEVCRVPHVPPIGKRVLKKIRTNERNYFCYDLTDNGLTVTIESSIGLVDTFYSYSLSNPSSALNDGTVINQTYIPAPNTDTTNTSDISGAQRRVCLTVRGIDKSNEYSLLTEAGDTRPKPNITAEVIHVTIPESIPETKPSDPICMCGHWLGDNCGTRVIDPEVISGQCREKGLYHCKTPGEPATFKGLCARCQFGSDPGLDFCGLRYHSLFGK